MGKIVGVDGKTLQTVDPRKIGVEDLIKMQDITRGHGTGLDMTDLLTVLIYELNRTKQYALTLGEVIKEKEGEINELRKDLSSSKPCSCPES